MPVQRIPRYSMLLQDMVKNTWPHHADYESLTAALKTILELASYVVRPIAGRGGDDHTD